MTFLPQFKSSSTKPVRPQILALGLVFISLGFVTDATIELASGRLRDRLFTRPNWLRRVDMVSGCVMLGLAGLVASTL